MDILEIKYYWYPKYDVYRLAHYFGMRLSDFLGKELFSLLLDSEFLLNHPNKNSINLSEETYKLHASAKALEGFLLKVIQGKKLREDKKDSIGNVFGDKDSIVRKKIKDKRLISKTKTVWDYCRNDVMHYGGKKLNVIEISKRHDEIKEIILELYNDFYGKSLPSEEITKIFHKELNKQMKKIKRREFQRS